MSHAWRPLFVVIGIIVAILIARAIVVPSDFGIGERGYMYGWHRAGNEQDWKDFKVKFRGREYCKDCHPENYELNASSPHVIIQCEDCHGPAIDHPDNPDKLEIIKDRKLCLRCHAKLPYDASGRAWITGINNEEHNPGMECVMCHNPHSPVLE